MGGIASCSLTNKYNKKIWVKYDVERKYVNMEDYTIEGQVGFSEFSVGAGVSVSKRYDWVKIQSQFTPIASGSDSFIELAVECKDSKVMYVTIVAEDGEIICNTLGKTDKNLIVTEDGQLRTAHEKNFTEVHPRYGKMKTTDPGPLNKNALPVVSGTTTNTKRAGDQKDGNRRRRASQVSAKKSGFLEIKDEGCCISGIAVTNNGTLLLADGSNKNIRSVSIDNKVLSVLSLPASPTAITVLNEITAVAAARNKNLYIINISDYTTLSVRDELKLRYNIIAMTSRNDNLFVTCSTDPETTKKISIGGEELWSVSAYGSGRDLFSLPWGIATTIIDKTVVVIVTDWDKNTLTLLEAETGILMRTVDVEGKAPYGITVDSDGNAYICCLNTLEICVWSNGFKESKVLLSKLGEPPRYIVYSRVNDSLYIAYNTINRIDCFQIQ